MRGRALKIGIALCGLAGVVYAADEATQPPEETLEQTIAQQLVNEGQEAHASGLTKDVEHYSSDEMLGLATKYDQDMRRAIEHAQDVKILAYRSHDIIRMTCIDDKIDQMKSVVTLTEPRYLMLRSFKSQLVVMQSQFALINIAHDRVTNLAAEVDACMGDNLDAVSTGRIDGESVPGTENINDPTRPQTSIEQIDRPPEASPYQ
jgi:hypothetical protein